MTAPQNKVFRQAALDRLASPEQLDRPVSLPPPRPWPSLAGLALAGLALLAWVLGRG